MPYVNVRITRGATSEQKERIVSGVTQLLAEVLGKKPENTFVLIDEVDSDNWGIGGETITKRQQRQA